MSLSARLSAALSAGLLATAACAQGGGPVVGFNGSLGAKAALLLIDGEPYTVAVGATVRGVRLLSVEGSQAEIELGSRRQILVMGASPGRVGDAGPAPNAGRKIVLSAGSGGHFTSSGTINGQTTQFLIDTGATAISISQTEAERLGLNFLAGRRVLTQTANGVVPAHMMALNTVRIGDVEVRNVEAIVIPGQMSHVLLGNSFLTRFQMQRHNDVLTLDLRY
ncbi:retropepsin-like aspartic protease family protein [Roseateles oligotrophus]|uniref:TIGR02281 family clan AA aspartic protease n=1 Tax=Roseateles oligotrophus TaxID=1769250 RepID=A0ABT2YGT4_9BURK|nr:TIGR02281 family clan AA aspartic protease [Roseateles oligotrophus]MCV2369258.1 TIGR02281 family clan AA aspartic protease [Roseateles oligotrophus]